MAEKKTRYKQGVDDGYISCANAVLHFMSSADRQHVQNLAETLGVTQKDMLKVEDKEDLDFEDDIHENSSYWK